MKTWPIKGEKNQVFAFEIKNVSIGVSSMADLLKTVPEVSAVSVRKLFSKSSDVHIEFFYCGHELMVWEPFGDNSRYWIGPRDDDGEKPDIEKLEKVFQGYQPSIIRKLLGG